MNPNGDSMTIVGEQVFRFTGTVTGDLSKLGEFQAELTALVEKHGAKLERFDPYRPREKGKRKVAKAA